MNEEKQDATIAQLIADSIDPDDPEAQEKAAVMAEMIVAMQPDPEPEPEEKGLHTSPLYRRK